MSSDLSSLELGIFKSVGIKSENVGPPLGMGAQSFVRKFCNPESGRPQVIKSPLHLISKSTWNRVVTSFMKQTAEEARANLYIAQQYFGEYVHPTEIKDVEGEPEKFVMIQDFVPIKPITPRMLSVRERVRRQVEEIMTANRKMIDEKERWFDPMGWSVPKLANFLLMGRPYFDNMVLDTATRRVRIIDTGFCTFKPHHLLPYRIQRSNAAAYGLNFGPKR